MTLKSDEAHLRRSIEIARVGLAAGERPVAALLTKSGQVVAEAHDGVFGHRDPTAHAERLVISEFSRANGLLHLRGYTLYTVVEPCLMCCGAIHWAKLGRVVYALSQSGLQALTGGSEKRSIRVLLPAGRHSVELVGPLLEDEALELAQLYPWKDKRV